MEIVYNLDDIFCPNNAQTALKLETENLLKNNFNNNINMEKILDEARKNIISKIIKLYKQNYYKNNNQHFKSELSTSYDINISNTFYNLNREKKLEQIIKQKDNGNNKDSLLNEKDSQKEILESIKELENSLIFMQNLIIGLLKEEITIDKLFFHKLNNGMICIQDWIKPYLEHISFSSISLNNTNIENYDFSETKGFTINPNKIMNNTIANTILKGVTFNCFNQNGIYTIDPSKINITGADFTGSKGAIVSLENIDKLPDNCNLTDALIVINSKEDITKFNLERFGNNFFIRQKSVIYKKMIDINLSDYLNYTGSIDTKELKTINDSLKIDCINEEDIRIENNKILSYLISTELSELIDYDLLYNIIKKTIIINGNSNNNENAYDSLSEIIKNKSEYKIADNYSKEKILSSYTTLFELLNIKYKLEDNILKFYTNNGKFTLDLLKIGYDNDNIYLTDTDNETFKNIFNLLYSFVFQQEEKKNNKIDNNDFNNISILANSYEFKHYTNSIIEDTIYNILEAKDYGYSETIKKIK